jgi:site-specific DNA recombinase
MQLLAYLRVSTKNQERGFSLEDQQKCIEQYCTLYQHTIRAVHKDAATGAKKNQGLRALLRKLYKEDLDGVIVDKLDRLFRNTEELLKTARILSEKGKSLISIKENFDFSTAPGKLILTVFSGIGEFEKSRIKERITQGKQTKKDAGGFTGGTIPFGYRVAVKHLKQDKTIKILITDEKEQEVISLIRRLRGQNKSYSMIATFLNDQGFTTKRKKKFTSTQVFRAMKSPQIG